MKCEICEKETGTNDIICSKCLPDVDWYDLGWSHGYNDRGPEYPDNAEYMAGYEQGCRDC